jgi:hypothetical protein
MSDAKEYSSLQEIEQCFDEKPFDELCPDCRACHMYPTCLHLAKQQRLELINRKQKNTVLLKQRTIAESMPNNEWISVQELTEKLFVEEKRLRQLLNWMVDRNWWDVKQHPEKKDLFMLIQ